MGSIPNTRACNPFGIRSTGRGSGAIEGVGSERVTTKRTAASEMEAALFFKQGWFRRVSSVYDSSSPNKSGRSFRATCAVA